MMQSFEDASKVSREFLDSSLKSFAALSKSMQTVMVEAADYSKKSFESGAAAMEELVSAKSLEKFFEVQTDFAKEAYEGFVAEAGKMTELFAEMAKEAYKPFESAAARAK